jgi:hypothetical protein
VPVCKVLGALELGAETLGSVGAFEVSIWLFGSGVQVKVWLESIDADDILAKRTDPNLIPRYVQPLDKTCTRVTPLLGPVVLSSDTSAKVMSLGTSPLQFMVT